MPRHPLVMLALLLVLPPVHVRAQTPQTPQQLVRIARISPWVDDSHPFRIVMQVTNASEADVANIDVTVTFFARVSSRSELREAIDRSGARGSVGSFTERVDRTIAPGVQETITIERDARALPFIRRNGVYPLDISLTHANGQTSVRTAIPSFTSAPTTPLNIVWVLPVSAPTVTPSDGVYPADVMEQLGVDRLAQQMRALVNRPGASVTLAPNPSLLDTIADLGQGFVVRGVARAEARAETSDEAERARGLLALIRDAGRGGELAAPPYAPADLAALNARGLGNDLLRQVTLGRAVVETHLGRAPTEGLLVGASAGGEAARAMGGVGVRSYILPSTSLATQPTEPYNPQLFGPSRPVALRVDDVDARALLRDEPLSARIDISTEGALLAQTLIAETASAFFELPLFAPERVLVIASEKLPSPVALRAALDGFTAAPWVTLRTASDALAALEPQGEPLELTRARPPDRTYLAAARAARAQLATLAAITVDQVPDAALLDRLVLLSESREWDAAPAAGEALARAVTAEVRSVVRKIRVRERVVTLTSRRGPEVPVTVFNGNPFPVRVRVHLVSPKLVFPAGDIQTAEITPPLKNVNVPVEARAAGSFPLEVLIETPDGNRVLARGTLVLRSTAISAVALGVVAGSIGLLLFSWARRGARRRRPRAVR